MELIKSPVYFEPITHTYSLGKKQLSGITGMIDRQIFGGKMQNIPDYILKPKAEYGHFVHGELEEYFRNGFNPISDDAKAFISWISQYQFEILEPEYIVSDEKDFATAIDLAGIWKDDKGKDRISLFDYKTSTELNIESVSWQLSIESYLFNLQNKCNYETHLFGVHLKDGQCDVIEVERKSDEAILRLFKDELSEVGYLLPDIQESGQIQALFDVECEIIHIEEEAQKAKDKKNALLAGLLKIMDEKGIKSWKTEQLTITKIDPTSSTSFDSKRFKIDNPDLFSQYSKVTQKSGYIKLTIHGNNPISE